MSAIIVSHSSALKTMSMRFTSVSLNTSSWFGSAPLECVAVVHPSGLSGSSAPEVPAGVAVAVTVGCEAGVAVTVG